MDLENTSIKRFTTQGIHLISLWGSLGLEPNDFGIATAILTK